MKTKLTVISFIFSFFFMVGCNNNSQKNDSENIPVINEAFGREVETTHSEISDQMTELTLTGKVISDPDKTISYTPLVSGVIERTYFSLGDRVRKGDVLMDLRSTDLSALEADLVTAKTELAVASREVKAAESLYKDGMLSEREWLEIQSQFTQAQATLEKMEADMSVFGVSKGKGLFSVRAPMDGYIISKTVSSGSTVSAEGESLFTIADLSSVWIMVNVYASNVLFVKEGMEAAISALAYPNEEFKGYISAISQVFDPEEKALKARIVMGNPDLKLKPEMSVVVTLKDGSGEKMVTVPSDAVIFDDNRYFVVVKEGANDFRIKQVIPQSHMKEVTYLASGLETGEEIVIKNQLLLYSELKEI